MADGPKMYMSGDLGGTNFRISLFAVDASDGLAPVPPGGACPGKLVHHARYRCADFMEAGFADMVGAFLEECRAEKGVEGAPLAACFSCAGPIKPDNTCKMTNLPWLISGGEVADRFSVPSVKLINDFVAAGYGLLTLEEHEYITLQEGEPEVGAPVACLGAGTGLGECYLTYDAEQRPTCHASEGGHTEWSPRSALEVKLQAHLKTKYTSEGSVNRVSVERVISGPGLADVYEFLLLENPEVANAVAVEFGRVERADQAVVVATNAATEPLCAQAMQIVFTAYGAEAGNVALKFLPFGGLYIAGGLAPKNKQVVLDSLEPAALATAAADGNRGLGFLPAFLDKGRQFPVMKRIPVRLVLEEDIGQRGAQYSSYSDLVAVSSTALPGAEAVAGDGTSPQKQLGVAAAAGALVGGLVMKLAKL